MFLDALPFQYLSIITTKPILNPFGIGKQMKEICNKQIASAQCNQHHKNFWIYTPDFFLSHFIEKNISVYRCYGRSFALITSALQQP